MKLEKQSDEEEIRTYIKQAKKLLFRTLNCCESQIIPYQKKLQVQHDELLRACTGLAGGLYNHGSTCGVVLGTSINYALQLYKEREMWTRNDQLALLYQIKKYVTWFRQEFQSTLCRERTGLDFTTLHGKIGLLIPSKAKGCILQTQESIKYFFQNNQITEESYAWAKEQSCQGKRHCALEVFQRIRNTEGNEHELLEHIAIIFDGGVGLTGNTCGALIGGIMYLGLMFRKDYTLQKAGTFRSLLRSFPPTFVKHANTLIDQFLKEFHSLECRGILNQEFSDWCDFQEKRENPICNKIITVVSNYVNMIMENDEEE